ncbi:MAG: ABC transporter ATP-binding protein [Dehalococcoidia bacterium]
MDTLQIELKSISKKYGNTQAVNNVTLKVKKGSILSVVGPSGCGKTTLLRLIAGFENPDQGELLMGGTPIWDRVNNVPVQKRNTGMIFQDGALFPHLDVQQNIGFAINKDEGTNSVNSLIELVGLNDKKTRMPHELSGGEQQRVALARSLATNPSTLLLDEPFSNLDIQIRKGIRTEVKDILKSYNMTAIFVTHDQQEAAEMGDQIAVMKDGEIEQIGDPEEVYTNPTTEFTATFFSQANIVNCNIDKNKLKTFISETDLDTDSNLNGNMKVLMYPHQLKIEHSSSSKQKHGIVKKKVFQGNAYNYTVELDNKESLDLIQIEREPIQPGSPVKVTYIPEDFVICFDKGVQKKIKVGQ